MKTAIQNKLAVKGGDEVNELKLKHGSIRLKADSDKDTAELYFLGDICSDEWEADFLGGTCPKNVTDFLSQLDKYADIDVHINSGGGDAFAGIAIYNILKRHKGKITVYIDGIGASSASIIAMAGDKIVMPKSSQLMIHRPWGMAVGNADEIRKFADSLDSCCQSIMEVYYENKAANVENTTLDELVKAESWLTPENAKNYFRNIEIEENIDQFFCPECDDSIVSYGNFRFDTEYKCEQCGRTITEEEIMRDVIPEWIEEYDIEVPSEAVNDCRSETAIEIDFAGKIFITTGLSIEDEKWVREQVESRGGEFKPKFVVSLSYLIYNPDYDHETTKYTRAKEQSEKGKPVQIITFEQFKKSL